MKVFLSSTALDLSDYRQVADDTILRLSQQTVSMERFGPLPGMPVDECERLARDSDVIVCIVAHRYGFVPERGKGSITRREVEEAKNAGKDVLVWIVADNYPWTEKKEQDLLADQNVVDDPNRVEEVREGVAGLIDFKAWLRGTFTPEAFTTPDDLGRKIAITLGGYIRGRSATPLTQDRVSISRLPTTGAELFGRESELKLLDDAWANPNTNIVSFVAWGGVGKTALVNHWLKRRMARDNYRGAERVYGWSFFSQGTSERAASADLFIDQALRWFGDEDPTAGSPWDKGERLARHMRHSRTLLVLDGLEPLQYPPGPHEGKVKDAALQALLVELAGKQPGLCVISTRERIGDLVEFEGGTVIRHDLEQLSPQAGGEILRSLNVKGDDDELEQASEELGGHAFSLTLLGSYLDEVFDGDIRRRREIENLFDDSRHGDNAQRMIVAYETWLGEGMELAILRLLGLFDRPADRPSIGALREPPVIVGLTEPLQRFKGREWNQAVARLRRIRLLGEASPNDPGTLDAHPLVREHFKQQLKRDRPEAWREANNRLYEYLKRTAKEFPDTLEEMAPLYAAMEHGCNAGRHGEALHKMYWSRIQRGDQNFSWRQLGVVSANLAVLSKFFSVSWKQPVPTLSENDRNFILSDAGFYSMVLGRFKEAIQPFQVVLDEYVAQGNFEGASVAAGNLCEVYSALGDLHQALSYAQKSVDMATNIGDMIYRVTSRAYMGTVLYLLGYTPEAETAFREAEKIQAEDEPRLPYLYSISGFWYCALLMDKGNYQAVKDRVSGTLTAPDSLLDVALENLSLGKSHLLQAQREGTGTHASATEYLSKAMKHLRQNVSQGYLGRGLLASAELHRFNLDYERAERDLAEVLRIATRSGMGLHLADYHLESARLRLAQGEKENAREHWTTAKEMIEKMSYHRRDKEVEEIEKQLGGCGCAA